MSFPLYIFPSGLPQPSHLLLITSFLFASSLIIKKAYGKQIIVLLFLIVVYMITRQLLYAMSSDHIDKSTLLPPIYFLFNILIFTTTVVFSSYVKNIDKYIKFGISLSLIIALIGMFYFGFSLQADDSGEIAYRAIGTFNNPNQLGYYSVCAGGIVTLLFINKNITFAVFAIMYTVVLFLAALSLSKSAMIAVVFYLFFFAQTKRSFLIVGNISLIAMMFLNIGELENYKFIERLADIGSAADDNLEHRGYGVLLNPDMRLLFGWGEGFTLEGHEGGGIGGHYGEVHSTLGSMVISYGLVGLMLFVYFLLKVFMKAKRAYGIVVSIALFMPFFLYGLMHNGIRFSIFWIYLGLLYGFSARSMIQNKQYRVVNDKERL